jgi:hypothetical protein
VRAFDLGDATYAMGSGFSGSFPDGFPYPFHWYKVAFDDSAWPLATVVHQPTVWADMLPGIPPASHPEEIPPEAAGLWAGNVPPTNRRLALFRWRFNVPAATYVATAGSRDGLTPPETYEDVDPTNTVVTHSGFGTDNAGPLGEFWLNDLQLGGAFPSHFVPGAENVLAWISPFMPVQHGAGTFGGDPRSHTPIWTVAPWVINYIRLAIPATARPSGIVNLIG